jgi:biotin operon repressor
MRPYVRITLWQLENDAWHRFDPIARPEIPEGVTTTPNIIMGDATIPMLTRLLYHCIKMYQRPDGYAYVEQGQLAAMLNISTRAVQGQITKLEERQMIVVEQQSGFNQPNRYKLIDTPGWVDYEESYVERSRRSTNAGSP